MKTKLSVFFMCSLVLFSSCGTNFNNKAKGGLIGGGGGAALGALIGTFAGKGKGAAIGAAVGAAVGTGAGILIGNKMDKAKRAAEMANAKAEEIKDEKSGLTFVKVTFDSGLLFATGKDNLSVEAKKDLSNFAKNLSDDMDLRIYGYTDNQGWKNSTQEQSKLKNLNLSIDRAKAVQGYLIASGISPKQILEVNGFGQDAPVETNSTATGRKANRRVEVFVLPSQEMINQAKKEAGEQ